MTIKEIITERRNPHNYHEIEMLIAGTKPVGLISRKNDLERLIPYIKSGQLIARKEFTIHDWKPAPWIIGQANNKKGVDAIYDLLKKKDEDWDIGKLPGTMYHARLGRLLGYSEDDINDFLNFAELKRQAGKW